jgi:hypothetical protein
MPANPVFIAGCAVFTMLGFVNADYLGICGDRGRHEVITGRLRSAAAWLRCGRTARVLCEPLDLLTLGLIGCRHGEPA